MVDSTSLRPHFVDTRGLKEAVTFLKEKMVLDKFIASLLAHPREGIVRARQVSGQ